MPESTDITINLNETFQHLPRAPIVEAVIQLGARAEVAPSEELRAHLLKALPEYSKVSPIRSVSVTVPLETEPHQSTQAERMWIGLRLETADSRNVAQFARDYFAFSRLKPYEDWQRFSAEALRLWEIHKGLAGPSEIRRIGVRFINRLELPEDGASPDEYFEGLAEPPPGDIPQTHFFYRNDLAIPGHPFVVRLVRTLQAGASSGIAILLDIDVFTAEALPPDLPTIQDRLKWMRWIKNRVFFANLTPKALDLCR